MKYKRIGSRRMIPMSLFVVATMAAARVVTAQASASATANATAFAVTPITLVKLTDIGFGAFVAGPGGTITLRTVGGFASTGITPIATAVDPPSFAFFLVSGSPNFVYTIALPTTTTVAGPSSSSMTVSLFASYPVSPITLSAAGTSSFFVGATLTVAAAQVPGAYAGTFNLTVNYQ